VSPTITFTHEYFLSILKGATIACEAAGYNIVLYTTALDHPEILHNVVNSKEVEGLLIFGGGNVEFFLNNLDPALMPIIVVGRQSETSSYSFISPDDTQGSYEACKHLIEMGHKKIAFIGQEADIITHRNRLRGYKQALNDFGIHDNQDYIFSAPFLPPGGYIAMKEVLNLTQRPTGIICFNDAIAVEGMVALREEGLRVPADVSIISFDDSSICEKILPKLSSIQIPLEEMGKKSVEMILKHIKDPTLQRETIRMPTKLILRDSTARISP
jgi:DNA-binding LacI/PurR family transcriptional regulator